MVATIICAVVAVFAIIILYLTRGNIVELLDRDVVMYDKNYQLKKEALQEAFDCLDLVSQNGTEIKNNPQFIVRAKEAYNGLLCTLNSAKLYQEFYRMAIDVNAFGYTVEDIETFKIACRAELISKKKSKGEGFKGSASGALNHGFGTSSLGGMSQTSPQGAQSRPQPATQQPRPQQARNTQHRPQPVRPQSKSSPFDIEGEE